MVCSVRELLKISATTRGESSKQQVRRALGFWRSLGNGDSCFSDLSNLENRLVQGRSLRSKWKLLPQPGLL